VRRLIVIVTIGATLVACATPEFRLRARFSRGEVREYRLVADADVRITAAGTSRRERSRLIADTRIEVQDVTGGDVTLMLTITPRSLTREGRRTDLPPQQQVRMKVSADGRVTDVTALGAQPTTLEAADVEDLVPLIGPPLPDRRVHLSDRWSRPAREGAGGGSQEARLAALGVVDGFDCAIVALSTRRPVVRERDIGGSTLRLEGVEFASGEIAFAFRQGLPVTVRSNAEARLAISGGTAQGGAVVIATITRLTLGRRTAT
jgi:hypothetical protein